MCRFRGDHQQDFPGLAFDLLIITKEDENMARSIDLFTEIVRVQIELWNQLNSHLQSTVGISVAQFQSMSAIGSGERMTRVQEISAEMRITVGAASKLVDRLERDGLATRSAHPTDRRSSIVALTDRGRRMLAKAEAAAEKHLSAAFSRINVGDRDAHLLTTLKSLRADLRIEVTQ